MSTPCPGYEQHQWIADSCRVCKGLRADHADGDAPPSNTEDVPRIDAAEDATAADVVASGGDVTDAAVVAGDVVDAPVSSAAGTTTSPTSPQSPQAEIVRLAVRVPLPNHDDDLEQAFDCCDGHMTVDLDEFTILNYVATFEALDRDHSGAIDQEELAIGLQALDPTQTVELSKQLLRELDQNNDGQVCIHEFLNACTQNASALENHIEDMPIRSPGLSCRIVNNHKRQLRLKSPMAHQRLSSRIAINKDRPKRRIVSFRALILAKELGRVWLDKVRDKKKLQALKENAFSLANFVAQTEWSVLGKGAQGTVYRAEAVPKTTPPTYFVLKTTENVKFMAVARNEAVINYELRSCRRVTTSLGDFEINGLFCMVYEYVEGKSIKSLAKKYNTLDKIKSVLRQLLEGIAEMSARGVVHGDVKTDNLLDCKSPGRVDVHIIDLGTADCGVQSPSRALLSPTNRKVGLVRRNAGTDATFLGTRDYLPPEITLFWNKVPPPDTLTLAAEAFGLPAEEVRETVFEHYDLRHVWATDVWALGIITLELLVGGPWEWPSAQLNGDTVLFHRAFNPSFGFTTENVIKFWLELDSGNLAWTTGLPELKGLPAADLAQVLAFLQCILRFNPADRSSPEELLKHPFLQA